MKHLLRALALVAALVVGSQAQATILVACGEDINCNMFGNTFIDRTAGRFNSQFARADYYVQGSNADTGAFPPIDRLETPVFSPVSNFWLTLTYFSTNWGSGYNFLMLKSADGVIRLALQMTGLQVFNILKRTAGGTSTTLASCGTLLNNVLGKLDVNVVDGTTGSITVYNNGVQLCTFSGDTTTDGVASIAQIAIGPMVNTSAVNYSEIMVADRDTRSLHPMSCAPLAAGNTQAWTGSVSNVNETTINDAAFNYDGTSNQLSQWTMSCPSTIQPSWGIVDVQQFARVAVGTSGPQHFRFSAHVAGTDYDNGADIAGLLSFQNYGFDWGANSPSGGAWTPAELNTGFSSGIESTP